MTQQVGQPFTITNVSLPTRYGFDIARIDENNVHGGFKDIEDRLPVNARALDGDMGTAFGAQPIRQLQQVVSHGGKGAHLPLLDREAASMQRVIFQ